MPWELTGNAGTNTATDYVGTRDNQPLVIRTNGAERARIDNNGNVGIGTTTPDTKLTVQADAGSGAADSRPAQLRLRSTSNPNSKLEIGYDAVGNFAVIAALTESVAWRNIVLANNGGNVGIGTTTPQARLHVNGDMIVSGDILLAGADYAEEFDVLDAEAADPGSVMILDEAGAVRISDRAYDGLVAGVISGAGDYKPAVILGHQEARLARRPLALMGKVYCKMDASYGPISIGDLLTTSATPGHAMKATDPERASGAIIGKALMSLSAGRGLVPILIALK